MIENPIAEYLAEHAGEKIPKKFARDKRDKVILEEYDRLIKGRTASKAIDIISRTHYVSERTVRRIINRRTG